MTKTVLGWLLQMPGALEALADPDCGWFYRRSADEFMSMPGSPIAYWAAGAMIDAFQRESPISDYVSIFLGMTTANNDLFVRSWWEVSDRLFCKTPTRLADIVRWAPYNKGGDFRRWYGNRQFIVNWENDGYAIRNFTDSKGNVRSTVPTAVTSLEECLTWSKISSGKIALRYLPQGVLFDVAGASGFGERTVLFTTIAFLNSSVSAHALSFMAPTLNYEGGQVRSLPLSHRAIAQKEEIASMVSDQISIAKKDWDSFETSWDFKRHPLI